MNSTSEFGLLDRDIKNILQALKLIPNIKEALIFGSRAKGNYKTSSDVDIAIKGQNINFSMISNLNDLLNEKLPLPYFFDIVNYDDINEPNLKDHIDRVGKIIYKKTN